MLSKKDISAILFKGSISQIPYIGPFAVETLDTIEQKKLLNELISRIERLENLLFSSGVFCLNQGKQYVQCFKSTHDYELIINTFEKSILLENTFENFIFTLKSKENYEFEYFSKSVKLKFTHYVLSKLVQHRNVLNAVNHNYLTSFVIENLTLIDTNDDTLLYYTSGINDKAINYGYLGSAWNFLGWHILAVAQKHADFIYAIECFSKAIEFGADPMVPLLNIANSFLGLGNKEFAYKRYYELSKRYPYSLQARHRLIQALDDTGNIAELKQNCIFYIEQFNERVESGAIFPNETILRKHEIENLLKKFS